MGKKQLIWVCLLTMFISVPTIVAANDNNQSQQGPVRPGWDMGYKTGYESGQVDHTRGAKFDVDTASGFNAFRTRCELLKSGSVNRCKTGYIRGFKIGYQDGFNGMVSRLASPVETPSAAEITPSAEGTQAPSEMARADEGTGTSSFRTGWDMGYKIGFESGQADHNQGAKLDADDAPGFRASRSTCEPLEGHAEGRCKKGYDEGFNIGYQDGYSGLVSRLISPVETPSAAELAPSTEGTQAPAEMARAEEGSGTSPFRTGWDMGYKTGYENGQADHNHGAKLDADDAPGYKAFQSTCEPLEGHAEGRCKKGYDEGFKLGYQDGYSGLVSRLASPPPASQAMEMPAQSNPVTTAPSQSQPPVAMQETPAAPESSTTNETPIQEKPESLPKTASSLPLLALIGLAGFALSFLFRALRKVV